MSDPYHAWRDRIATRHPDVMDTDECWRCECGGLNHWSESFCYRCGAGQPEEDE